MTSNVSNQGIAHAGFRPGAMPLCGNRRAHYVTTIDKFRNVGAAQCQRCAARLAEMDRKLAVKISKASEAELRSASVTNHGVCDDLS